jgi:hypothetical protein
MIARDESEDVGNISNETVKDIVHAALLKGKGKCTISLMLTSKR